MNKPKVLVFASGSIVGGGSGFENLVLASRSDVFSSEIVGVVSNHAYGGVRTRAYKLRVPFLYFPKPWTAEMYQKLATDSGADFFILSGWLKLVVGLDPTTNFNSRTVFNIHPGPLPKFGGQGLYGNRVHEAVATAFVRREITHTAVSMHFVTEKYDKGPVFFKCNINLEDGDTADSIRLKVAEQEHIHQPRISNMVVNGHIRWNGKDTDSLETPDGYKVEHFA